MHRLVLAALAVGLLATPAMAQEKLNTGWYGTLSAAALSPRDTDFSDGANSGSLEFDTGFGIYAAGGYRFANGFRTEAELSYGKYDLDRFTLNGVGSATTEGDVKQYSLTGAVFYDVATGTMFTPYIGAGAGIVRQKLSDVVVGGAVEVDGDTATDFTAFGELGVNIKLTSKLDLVPAYRYQWINDGEDGVDDSNIHVFKLGLRYWFN